MTSPLSQDAAHTPLRWLHQGWKIGEDLAQVFMHGKVLLRKKNSIGSCPAMQIQGGSTR